MLMLRNPVAGFTNKPFFYISFLRSFQDASKLTPWEKEKTRKEDRKLLGISDEEVWLLVLWGQREVIVFSGRNEKIVNHSKEK